MSLERYPEQVLVKALAIVLLQFGFSTGSCGVASGSYMVLDRVEEAHSEFTLWM
jgi:hypothetical protein